MHLKKEVIILLKDLTQMFKILMLKTKLAYKNK
jgi:hypothetical protein